jgi:hypothetical protein
VYELLDEDKLKRTTWERKILFQGMGCIGSKVEDNYVLGVLEPGEVVTPEASVRGSKIKSSASYRDQKQLLKGKYKVNIAEKRANNNGGGGSRSNDINGRSQKSQRPSRANSSPALGGTAVDITSDRKGNRKGSPKGLTNSTAASARAKARFKSAGTKVKAAVRLRKGINGSTRIKRSLSAGSSLSSSSMNIDHFQFLDDKAIGKGAFSYVRLAQSKDDQQWYAIKCICKEKACRHKNTPRHLRNEKEILSSLDNPFVIQFYGSFQDPIFIYLTIEYIPGGELHRLIYHRKNFSLDMSIFYAAGKFLL